MYQSPVQAIGKAAAGSATASKRNLTVPKVLPADDAL